MKILAVEFSSAQRGVAVVVDGHPRGAAMETASRETRAFDLIARALAEAGVEREQIECLAIGLGPGSYTGIRSAIALAQGWQLALPVRLLGISSVECLAAEAQARAWFGTVNIVVDAQRNELYVARYAISPGGCHEVEPLKLDTPTEVLARTSAGEIIAGPEAERWFAGGRILFPSAAMLGKMAVGRANFVPGEKLEPIYLRETTFVKAPPPRILPAG